MCIFNVKTRLFPREHDGRHNNGRHALPDIHRGRVQHSLARGSSPRVRRHLRLRCMVGVHVPRTEWLHGVQSHDVRKY